MNPPAERDDVREILLDNEYLTNQNGNYRSYCQDLADFCLPRKAWINSIRHNGERLKFNFLYDTTAGAAVRDAAAGVQTYLTNQTSKWFGIEYDKELMADRANLMFCHDVVDWTLGKLNGSNFYNVELEWLTDLFVFGTGTFGIFADDKRFISCREFPVGQVNRVVDVNGELIEMYINFKLPARKAFKLFGSQVGETVMKSLEKKPFEEFDFVHYVGERHIREVGKDDAKNMPYRSLWIAVKDKHVMGEGGFEEMPYFSDVFYSDPSDANGFSPCMDCFAEIKLVNAMMKTTIRGAMKQVDPPFSVPSRGFMLPLNWNPGSANYRDAKTPHDALQLIQSTGRIDLGVDLIKMVQEKIQNRLFVDLFRSLNEVTKQMTVLETQQRISQAMALLGPVVNRFTGTLGRMITRVINMGARDPLSGFPAIPEVLADKVYNFVFLGPLAMAQKQSEIVQMQSYIGDVMNMIPAFPRIGDNLNEDKIASIMHKIRGLTPEILREENDRDQRRKHADEQQQIIAAMQGGQAVADIAKTGSETHKNLQPSGAK